VKSSSTSARARLWVAAAALAFYLLFILRTSFRIGDARYFVRLGYSQVGVRITSERFACHLAAQFHAAISDGVLVRIG